MTRAAGDARARERQRVAPAKRKPARRSTPAKSKDTAAPDDLRGVRVSHPDKVYWPEEGYTKLDLLRFYMEAFPRLRPYVEDRMLSLERCPDGMKGQCFFQKEKPQGLPEDTPTVPIQHAKGITNYVVGGRLQTQLALANLGCIAVHVWGSRRAAPRKPDWVCFDLDPDSGRFADAVSAALKIKAALDALSLESYPKTSGGKGLHVFVPIRPGPDCDEALEFAERLGSHLAAAYPKELHDGVPDRRPQGPRLPGSLPQRLRADRGRAVLRAAPAGRAVLRSRSTGPRSSRRSTPNAFNLGTAERRLRRADPWEGFFRKRQSLKEPLRAVRDLAAS